MKETKYAGYFLDRDGNLWSSKVGNLQKPITKPRLMKVPSIRGYKRATLFVDGERLYVFVHSLMLETFVGSRPDGHVCRHLNGRQDDNRIENLAWGTPRENYEDVRKHGKHRGSKNHNAVLTEKQAMDVKNSTGKLRDVAEKHGISIALVSSIRNGRSWKHLP